MAVRGIACLEEHQREHFFALSNFLGTSPENLAQYHPIFRDRGSFYSKCYGALYKICFVEHCNIKLGTRSYIREQWWYNRTLGKQQNTGGTSRIPQNRGRLAEQQDTNGTTEQNYTKKYYHHGTMT